MAWVIDLDDGNLDAWTAIIDSTTLNSSNIDFSLVPLNSLFPNEDISPNSTIIKYSLVNFGNTAAADGSMDPSSSRFGSMLLAGDSFAISTLERGDGEPEPFVFLDCPTDVLEQPEDNIQSARVVCFSHEVDACFQVVERAVEGTLVEMPDNLCAELDSYQW